MSRATIGQVLNLVLEVQHQMHQGFHDVRIEMVSMEQRLTNRIDRVEERVDDLQQQINEMRTTQVEDGQAIREVLMGHERRLVRLEKGATSH
ncbi:MAG: hypothetical protein Q7S64_00415 [bacterium]|nr:hypothetical protein [bacterium]